MKRIIEKAATEPLIPPKRTLIQIVRAAISQLLGK